MTEWRLIAKIKSTPCVLSRFSYYILEKDTVQMYKIQCLSMSTSQLCAPIQYCSVWLEYRELLLSTLIRLMEGCTPEIRDPLKIEGIKIVGIILG
jgi:hypothetical protein